jgi:transposase
MWYMDIKSSKLIPQPQINNRRCQMKAYAGIDLHSRTNFLGIIDEKDRRLFKKKLPNCTKTILSALKPFKKKLVGIVVESTYNWYWLADALNENGYKIHLANPAAIRQYEGLKHTDDQWDSFWLAHMLRLGILPEGYIYPKAERPIRDLLRRRGLLVRQRTAQILSLQSMISRNRGLSFTGNDIKCAMPSGIIEQLFDDKYLVLAGETSMETIEFLSEKIRIIEKEILSLAKPLREFTNLQTIPGLGPILALTIMLEVGDIARFPSVGDYSSYCRCVKSQRLSNGKKKGSGNRKNGNKYLGWAYVELANFAIRYCSHANRFYLRKKAKTNRTVAIKALGNKLARASYYIMRDNVPYDPNKLFS